MANRITTEAKEATQLIRDTAASTAATLLKFTQDTTTLALDISYIKADLAEIKVQLDNKYVTKEEFATVRTLVYGFAGLILTSVVLSLIYLVVSK